MASLPSSRRNVFISYNHKDAKYLERLHIHLKNYGLSEIADFWDDTKIAPGANWRDEIKKAIQSAKVAVLLISADFLASEYITKNELPPLLAAAKIEGTTILPIILSPCAFEYTELSCFQAVNSPSKPLAKLKGYQRDELWVKVVNEIRKSMVALPAALSVPVSSPVREQPVERVVPAGGQSQPALTLEQVQDRWERIKKRVRVKNQAGLKTAAYLNNYVVVSVEPGDNATIVTIQAAHMVHYQYLHESEYCPDVEDALNLEFRQPCKLRLLPPE